MIPHQMPSPRAIAILGTLTLLAIAALGVLLEEVRGALTSHEHASHVGDSFDFRGTVVTDEEDVPAASDRN